MSNVVIRVENLSKQYRLGTLNHGTLYRDLQSWWARKRGREDPNSRIGTSNHRQSDNGDGSFWALKDVSFEVEKGEVVGIIGRNGAGKSTLLKILSRVTAPTTGEVKTKGRIASLLEVGTGFHPELTGRENIYLNGAILGMTRTEIKKKFEEIVAFAEIEKFLDTPVKRYSSGMYVRLAFAVAAHLEPEILIVDEVLAVGDIDFQKKCLGKMESVAKEGRTVLFVSHAMHSIRDLCKTAILLDYGRIIKSGEANEVVNVYENHNINMANQSSSVIKRSSDQTKSLDFYFSSISIQNENGEYTTDFKYNDTLIMFVELDGVPIGNNFSVEFYIYNELGHLVCVGGSGPYYGIYYDKTVRKVNIKIGPLFLTMGKYLVKLSMMFGTIRGDTWEYAAGFTIRECKPFKTSWEAQTFREGTCVIQHSFSGEN